MKYILLVAISIFSSIGFSSEKDPLKVSLLTCSTGPDLHAAFGHTGIRITNTENKTDYVFDYGIFDWDTPNFLLQFLSGTLQYKLSKKTFDRFYNTYKKENRGIIERQINLRYEEKLELYLALEENRKPENRYYDYEFFKANCTTKARDILLDINGRGIDGPMPDITFRQGLHQCLEKKPWIQFGADIILGSKADRRISYEEAMFMPHLLDESLSAYPSNRDDDTALVDSKTKRILPTPQEHSSSFFTQPFFIIMVLGMLIAFMERKKPKWGKMASFSLLVIAGLIGVMILFLWFGSRHEAFSANLNIIWANPILIVFPFLRRGLFKYRMCLSILAVMTCFLGLAFFGLLGQEFNLNVLLFAAVVTGILASYALRYRKEKELGEVR